MPGHKKVKRAQFRWRLHQTQLAVRFDSRRHATRDGEYKFCACQALKGCAKVRHANTRLALCANSRQVLVRSEFAYSERQASKLMSLDRTTCRYQLRADHNAELRSKLIALARPKPRYGYRRLCALLERSG